MVKLVIISDICGFLEVLVGRAAVSLRLKCLWLQLHSEQRDNPLLQLSGISVFIKMSNCSINGI